MFSSFATRLAARSSFSLIRSSSSAFSQPRILSSVSLSRSYFTTPRVLLPATASTAKKPAATKKTSAKKPAQKAVAKKKPVKKTAAKKKPAAKKRVTKKPVKPKSKFDKSVLTPPKRPMNSYMLFTREKLSTVDLKNKSLQEMAQTLKGISALWRELPDTSKQVYREKHQEAMEQWRKDYEKWYLNLPDGAMSEIKKKRKAKGLPAISRPKDYPKKAASPFIYYTLDVRRQNPNLSLFETSKVAGEQWKKLSDSEKQPYVDESRRQSEKFAVELEQYKKANA
ncbi:hypothetical protein VNI00_009666 [Paramarasmius palmivorus]|uniref:HMG box domain-containing protein n=1 Tax=Paramarasmius palmivorus TaxID=297713 RepID=A0AAW0CM20_9AGAR